ncbi:hypothetical protein [Streptomyces sp. NPDC029674]|uniref:hypothetical protein n=1 Tax=Streptomyces sp. NPDC029674 TaxID=3365297 RepID=UPI00384D83D6
MERASRVRAAGQGGAYAAYAEMAHAIAFRHRLEPTCGVRASWVAERRRGEVVGALTAAPPLGWIGSIKRAST